MYILLLDEFGDTNVGFGDDPNDKATHISWRPVGGYGGILLPAKNYQNFCDDFAYLRIINLRNHIYSKKISAARQRVVGDQSDDPEDIDLKYHEFRHEFKAQMPNLFSKSGEVKGSRVFSASYINDVNVDKRKVRSVLRRARRLFEIIERNEGYIFYYASKKQNISRPRAGLKWHAPFLLRWFVECWIQLTKTRGCCARP